MDMNKSDLFQLSTFRLSYMQPTSDGVAGVLRSLFMKEPTAHFVDTLIVV